MIHRSQERLWWSSKGQIDANDTLLWETTRLIELECLGQHELLDTGTELHVCTAADQTTSNHRNSVTQWFHSQALQLSLQLQLFTSASQEVFYFLGAPWRQSPIRWKVSNESRRIKQPHLTLLSLVPNCEQDEGGRFSFHILSFNTRKKDKGRKKHWEIYSLQEAISNNYSYLK